MVTGEILCTGYVTNIAALVEEWGFPQDAFLLIERLPQQVVADEERRELLRFARLRDVAHPHEGIDLARYTSGRIFCPDFELRWNQDASGTKVVYLGAERKLPGLDPKNDLKELKKSDPPKYYYLFGEYLDEDKLKMMGVSIEEDTEYYAQVRIPRLLRYPAPPGARRVQLAVCEYTEEKTGKVKLFRFHDLIAAE